MSRWFGPPVVLEGESGNLIKRVKFVKKPSPIKCGEVDLGDGRQEGETRLTNLPGQWLQCQANGSNVCLGDGREEGEERYLFFSSLSLSSLELSDTQVYTPYIRALLGTASHFCKVVVLKLRPG